MNLKPAVVTAVLTLSFALPASASTSLSDLSSLLGKDTTSETTEQSASSLDVSSLVSSVTENLGVTESQSEGGLASIFSYVKDNLSTSDYTDMASNITGLDSLLESVPDIDSSDSSSTSSSALSGLMDKASEYSDTINSANELKNQFEALGLSTDMISSFVSQISSYFNSEDATETQSIFESGLGNLLSGL
ncbi:DUF2780 domain-containing protein [Alteromonas sp. C1M14]|uniref:DUF2780 domain-containing protein n=1 Tax=Alteromonas sp. C1M14 TaxID=2841567 RepID=UPI001C08DA3D|nr:DUF2780 domain-containing protein [Alteromonas sp. C1M14]MBU2979633.1 DUF2780 domain-containing protein [Alteromonas sp. C1M14]